jgi:hypothetical protein
MLVRTDELVARMTDQKRASHQLVMSAAVAIAKAAAANVCELEGSVVLDEGRIAGTGIADVVAHREQGGFKKRGHLHATRI